MYSGSDLMTAFSIEIDMHLKGAYAYRLQVKL